MIPLTLRLADAAGLRRAQQLVTTAHYLRRPVDPRCRPLAYLVVLHDEYVVGCLIVGRLQSTRCGGWYGTLDDVARGWARLSYGETLGLLRVYLDPSVQQGGASDVPNAATWAVGQVCRRAPLDYLLACPPVDVTQPYLLRDLVSYSNPRLHQGTLYRAAGFRLERMNDDGLLTWVRPLRGLQPLVRRQVRVASARDERARRLRSRRATTGVRQRGLLEVIA